MSIKVTKKGGSRTWINELCTSAEYKSAVDEEGRRIAAAANSAANAVSNVELSWHCRYFGRVSSKNLYIGGVYTMSNQAKANPTVLLKE